nr:hypothetical protein [Luteimonas cucumeris]
MPVHLCALSLAIVALAGCRQPEPPPTERPPEPQAQHTQLRDAIQQPIDKAKAVEQTVQDAAVQQRAAIDAAGG